MRMFLFAALTGALVAAGSASATPPKAKSIPFKETATTCSTYASVAFVQQLTGISGTPQKGPAGQCHFTVDGSKSAFQIGVHQMGTRAKTLAFLQDAYNVSASQAGDCAGADASTPTPCGTQYVTGLADKAVVFNDPFLCGVYAIRGSEFFAVQWAPRSVTLTDSDAERVIRALLAKVPK